MARTIRPTIPGMTPGIVGVSPWEIQCQECGHTYAHEKASMAVLASGIHFHALGWPDGLNPRLCRPCRLSRGCNCQSCSDERRSA